MHWPGQCGDDVCMRVRQAVLGDERTIRDVRLRALADAPDAFASTLARELERTDADWQRWTTSGATFLCEDASGVAMGVAAARPDFGGAAIVWLQSMWVDPAARGVGVGDTLVQAVLSWAQDSGYPELRLHVRDGNVPAERLYARNGFVAMGDVIIEGECAGEVEMRALPRQRDS